MNSTAWTGPKLCKIIACWAAIRGVLLGSSLGLQDQKGPHVAGQASLRVQVGGALRDATPDMVMILSQGRLRRLEIWAMA